MEKKDLEQISEYVIKGIQASKQENSGLFREIKNEFKIVHASFKGVHDRLDDLNGKVARNVEKIQNLEKADIGILQNVGDLLKDKDERYTDERQKLNRWQERLIWVAIVVVVFILAKVGLVSPEVIDVLN